jgi:hypothetical protein
VPAAANPPPLIDLGDDFDARPDAMVKKPADRRWARGVQVAIPLVSGLFVITGSIPLGSTPFPLVARLPVGISASVLVTDGDAIVVDIADRRNRISEYALNGGHLVWSSPLTLLASDVDVQVAGDVIVVGENNLQISGAHTEAFDLHTGKRLWDSVDGLRGVDVSNDLIMESVMSTDAATQLRRVNAQTGDAMWSAPVPGGCDTTFGDDPDNGIAQGIAEICVPPTTPAGSGIDQPTLRVLDFTTGAVRATRTLHLSSSAADFYLLPSERLPGPELSVVGDAVLVTHDNLPTATVDAFRISDLAPLWSGLSVSSTTYLQPCGPDLCVYHAGVTTKIDLHTGLVIPGAVPVDPLIPVPGGVALIPVSRAHLLVTSYAVARVPDGVAVTVPLPTPGETWVAALRSSPPPGESATRPIQPLHHIGPGACIEVGAYLACSASKDQLVFWRLPA